MGATVFDHLKQYDLEYAELAYLNWRQAAAELQVGIFCLVKNWYWKQLALRVATRLRLGRVVIDPHVDYRLDLILLGVSEVINGLDDWLGPAGSSDFTDRHFEVELIRSVELDAERSRFYLSVEGRKLELTYRDFTFLQKPGQRPIAEVKRVAIR